MNVNIEDIRVYNDHAIRCSLVCKPVNVIEYVKAVSSAIGASHILAVFEERDSVKIYLNDKRFVDALMKSCLHVMGRHVKVDYASPPGTRLILTDVDPIISNYDVMRLLSVYGTVVSPVIRPPISDDPELCHIGYGVRYLYINLSTDCVPESIDFKYGESILSFKVHIETADVILVPNMKVDTFDDAIQDNENSCSSIQSQDVSSPPVLVSVQSVHSNEEECSTPPKILNSDANVDQGSGKTKRRGRPPSPLKRMRMAKKITATSKAARKIKRNVKHKWIRKRYRKGKAITKQMLNSTSPVERNFRNLSNNLSSSVSVVPELPAVLVEMKEEDEAIEVLGHEQLLEFLHEVKNNRAPLELAKKYLGNDGCDSMIKFINQLEIFRKREADVTLKTRIWRLIKSLKDQLNISSQSISDMD